MLRIADNPLDWGRLLAALGLWDEALPLWTEAYQGQSPDDEPWGWHYYAGLLLVQGETDAYRRFTRQLLDRAPNRSNASLHVAAACALAPIDEDQAHSLVALMDRAVDDKKAYTWPPIYQARVYYRAKRYQDALRLLTEAETAGNASWLLGEICVLKALCQQALDNVTAARSELQKADSWAESLWELPESDAPSAPVFTRHINNGALELVHFLILSREAHRVIADDGPPDRRFAEFTKQVRAYLQRSDKISAAFDRAILTEPDKFPYWLGLARARVAMGQADLADRELERIIRGAPKNPDPWKTRARVYAELGRTEQAAADFDKALTLSPASTITWFGVPRRQLSASLAQWPDVFDRVVKLRPGDDELWIGRGHWHSQHKRWQQAADDFARVNEQNLFLDELCDYAGPRLLHGDVEDYQRICQRLTQRLSPWTQNNPWAAMYLAKVCSLSTTPPVDLLQLVHWAEVGHTIPQTQGLGQLVLGLAYYRAGQLPQATATLQDAASRWKYGKQPVEKQQIDLVLAMCEYHMGQTDQANQRLQKACEMIDQAIAYTAEDPFAVYPSNWITLHLLRREAEELILDKQPQAACASRAFSWPPCI